MMNPSRVGSWYYNYNEDDTLEHRFSVLNELRNDQKLCDAVIKVGGQVFHVHKAVLACCSPYFRALFTNGMQESGKNELEISDIDPGAMGQVIHYAYTFEVIATGENVEVLMATADKLNVTGILGVCQEVIQKCLSHANCFHYLGFSRTFNFQNLEQKVIKFIKVNFDQIGLMNYELLELDFEEIEQLLSSDELNVRSEELVFETVIRWINHAPDARISHLPRLLNCVRLGLVPTEFFLDKISGNKYLKKNEDCKSLLKNTWDFLYELDRTANKDIDLQNPLVRPRIPHEVLYAVGGWSGGNPITFFESYDTRADRWYTHAFVEDNTPRAYHALASLDAKIYIIGKYIGRVHCMG
jgi:kelch-like protein 10